MDQHLMLDADLKFRCWETSADFLLVTFETKDLLLSTALFICYISFLRLALNRRYLSEKNVRTRTEIPTNMLIFISISFLGCFSH
jgi:hypothetical protein